MAYRQGMPQKCFHCPLFFPTDFAFFLILCHFFCKKVRWIESFSLLLPTNAMKNNMAQKQIDQLDKQILKLISADARIPFLEVSRICGVSGAAVHQRIQKLTKLGILRGAQFLIDPEHIGYETCAYMGLFLKDPSQFDGVVDALKAMPEVVECHYTTGKYDMFIKVYARNNHELLNMIHDKLQPLGLASTETIISFKESFSRQIPMEMIFDE